MAYEMVKDVLDGMDEFIERKILVGMIVNGEFLGRIQKLCGGYRAALFAEGPAQNIAEWCFKFFDKYGKAPNNAVDLRILFETGSRKIPDIDMREFIEGILDSLSQEYELNPEDWEETGSVELLYDQAVRYLKARSYMVLSQTLKECIQITDVDESLSLCEETITKFKHVQVAGIGHTDLFLDDDLLRRSLEKESKPIFTLPGALGQAVNGQLVEGGFISLMGPEKRGKSWILMEIALQACKQKVPTALIQAGDMDDEDMAARIQIRLAKKSNRERYCGELAIPILDCAKNQRDECTLRQRTCLCGVNAVPVARGKKAKAKKDSEEMKSQERIRPIDLIKDNPDYTPCSECIKSKNGEYEGAYWWTIRSPVEPLAYEESKKNTDRIYSLWKCSPRIATHPADTLTVSKLKQILEEWDTYDSFRPRVIVIDYMDLLAPEKFAAKDFRHSQNEIWKQMRGLAQQRHCLIVSATQANAASYEEETLSMANFSEDKRKYGHVTAMWGLNQTFQEKTNGVMRINQLVARNDEFNSRESVTILQSLQTGQPMISSFTTR